jgi:hypothetical protein
MHDHDGETLSTNDTICTSHTGCNFYAHYQERAQGIEYMDGLLD